MEYNNFNCLKKSFDFPLKIGIRVKFLLLSKLGPSFNPSLKVFKQFILYLRCVKMIHVKAYELPYKADTISLTSYLITPAQKSLGKFRNQDEKQLY